MRINLLELLGITKKTAKLEYLEHIEIEVPGVRNKKISNQVKRINKNWCISDNEEFHITINCPHELIAIKAKDALYNSTYIADGELYCDLAELIVMHSIECIQIKQLYDNYVEKYRKTYSLLESKYPIDDFNSIGDLQHKATTKLKIPSSCAVLFDFESSTSWIYSGNILLKYDPQALRFYIRRYNKYGKLWKVEASGSFAKIALRCCKTGLARKGRDIPLDLLIQNLPVKTLSQALEKKHTRRKNAIEAMLLEKYPYDLLEKVCNLNNYYEFYVTIDEIELAAINKAWAWAETVSSLLRLSVGVTILGRDDRWIKQLS